MFRAETVVFLGALLAWSVLTKAPPLFVLALILLLAAGFSKLWERYCLVRIEYRRVFPSRRVSFGKTIALEIEVVNRKLLPLSWLEFDDGIPSALPPSHGRISASAFRGRSILSGLMSLRPYERVRRYYPIHCTTRGEHSFGPVRLRSGDLFGFVDCEKVLPIEDTLIVYPRVLPLDELGLPARNPLGEQRTQSWLFEDTSRLAGARELRPGEGLRRVHWPASARAQSLQTRIYESTTSHRLSVFLDVDTPPLDDPEPPGASSSAGDADVLELGITTAASIASWGLERGYQTGIYANGGYRRGGGCVIVEPAGDRAQLERVLLALARLHPGRKQPFDEFLSDQLRRLPFGTSVVVVAAALSPGTRAQLVELSARGNRATVVMVGRGNPPDHLRGVTVRQVGPPESWREIPSLVLSGGSGRER